MKPKRVIVEPFRFPIYIATSDESWEELDLDRNAMEGAVLTFKGKMYVALPEDYEEYVTWHEAHHVARMLNGAHGVPTDADEHEADCYLQEHVVRLIKSVYAKDLAKALKKKGDVNV
tara:strand:+ start:562 stop:912 length:351 start_codon:yes stop_codon:yes gene_type:complete